MRTDLKSTAVAAGLMLTLVLAAATSLVLPADAGHSMDGAEISGVVVDAAGHPIAGAEIDSLRSNGEFKDETDSDDDGTFTLYDAYPVLLRISADGYASRVVAAAPGSPVRPVLTKAGSDTVSLRLGGDVMFGRRFYEANSFGTTLITDPGSVDQHRAILAGLGPMLGDSDITAVNLETALVSEDVLRRSFDSRDGLHPDKDFAIVSSVAAAQALKESGVDVVSLGNNHSYDALESGTKSTIEALDKAGIAHFGAGLTVDDAWKPAILTAANGHRVAFVGCTTVEGSLHEVSYVAEEGKGGAALCEDGRLAGAVADAAAQADTVVVMVHGGIEYQREQADEVQALTTTAIEAGASSVVNHHPHVAGKLRIEDGAFVAESMGNLVFDQPLWETLPSYLLRLDIQGNHVTRGAADPIVLNGYIPRPAVGDLADSIARTATGGAGVLGSIQLPSPAPYPLAPSVRSVALPAGEVRRLNQGEWVESIESGYPALGRDLLRSTGSFERAAVGESTRRPSLWKLGEHVSTSSRAQCGRAQDGAGRGIVFTRGGLSRQDAVATPVSRIPVTAGVTLTLRIDLRSANSGGVAEIGWYDALAGSSFATTSMEIPQRSEDEVGCRTLSLDVIVPKGAVAAQPIIRLNPPRNNTSGNHIAIDNVCLIEWFPWQADVGKMADTVGTKTDATVSIGRDQTS